MKTDAEAPFSNSDIPQDVLDDIRETLWTYTTSVFSVQNDHPVYCGTATCVAAGGKDYLLTAAHVWRKLHRHDRFALTLNAERALLDISRETVEPTIWEHDGDPELGPDLAVISLPQLISRQVRQEKAFYNIDKRRPLAGQHPQYDAGAWAIIGVPDEWSDFTGPEAVMKLTLFVSIVERARERGGFDYVDLGYYQKGKPDHLKSYGGMSGSGLWQFTVQRSPAGKLTWLGDARLEGVAFYQLPSDNFTGVVRCHGRASLYERAFRLE